MSRQTVANCFREPDAIYEASGSYGRYSLSSSAPGYAWPRAYIVKYFYIEENLSVTFEPRRITSVEPCVPDEVIELIERMRSK